MLHVRKSLLWDYDVPEDPERDEGFLALYVGRVLDRGTAEDVRRLGLDRIRRYLEAAPARREVKEFWRWWLAIEGKEDGDSQSSAAPASPDRCKPSDASR